MSQGRMTAILEQVKRNERMMLGGLGYVNAPRRVGSLKIPDGSIITFLFTRNGCYEIQVKHHDSKRTIIRTGERQRPYTALEPLVQVDGSYYGRKQVEELNYLANRMLFPPCVEQYKDMWV